MSSDYVLDAEPLVAYLYDEPGADRVESILTAVYDDATAAMSEVTATELVYKTAWLQADGRPDDRHLQTGRRRVRDFRDQGVRLVPPTDSWPTAATVKADGGIALGDAFAVALAHAEDATLVVGADDDFADLPVPVELERVRSDPT
jgi:PIN domain nuclease of toxin-antitoxin system